MVDVNSVGIFLSASINRDVFASNFYSSYLIQESLMTAESFKEKIQEAIDSNKDLEYVESLIKESDYYDSLLNFAILGTDGNESPQ